jgi:hypothetical protein
VERRAYERLCELREDFRANVELWRDHVPGLLSAQAELAAELGEDNYELETSVVYNKALDDIGPESLIDWIVVADNPGKREQAAAMNRYLVGQSGKVMENFFRRELHSELRSRSLIINKTPVHTPKTAQLKALGLRHPDVAPVLADSQRYMARLAIALHEALGAKLWIMGLSELRPAGIFSAWKEAFMDGASQAGPGLQGSVYAFNHFSMGSFSTDLKKRRLAGETVPEAVLRIGRENSLRIFGY